MQPYYISPIEIGLLELRLHTLKVIPWPWKSGSKCDIHHSNEVLSIDFGQGAAKISEVKVEG